MQGEICSPTCGTDRFDLDCAQKQLDGCFRATPVSCSQWIHHGRPAYLIRLGTIKTQAHRRETARDLSIAESGARVNEGLFRHPGSMGGAIAKICLQPTGSIDWEAHGGCRIYAKVFSSRGAGRGLAVSIGFSITNQDTAAYKSAPARVSVLIHTVL